MKMVKKKRKKKILAINTLMILKHTKNANKENRKMTEKIISPNNTINSITMKMISKDHNLLGPKHTSRKTKPPALSKLT